MFTQIPWFCFLPFPEDAAPCVWCGLILFLPDCNVTFVQHSWSFIVMMLDHLNYAVQCNYIWGMPFCLRCKQHKADIVYVSLMFVFLKVSSQLISNEWIDEYMNRRDSVKDKFIGMICNYAYNSIGNKMRVVLQPERKKERIKKKSPQVLITNEQGIHYVLECVGSKWSLVRRKKWAKRTCVQLVCTLQCLHVWKW